MALVFATKEVSKELYERVKARYEHEQRTHYPLSQSEEEELFDVCIRWGYGLYGASVCERDGKYYCEYEHGSSCD